MNKRGYQLTKEEVMPHESRSAAEKMRGLFLPSGPRPVAEPEKELRFTRGSQAPLFYMISALTVCGGMALMILSTQNWGMDEPPLKDWWWLAIPDILVGFWFLRLGMRCSKHAYIILTPLAVEIFPFFNARKNLRVVYWSEVHDAEVKDGKLMLHFSEHKDSGVVASLQPIPPRQRDLLKTAVDGLMNQRRSTSS